MRNAVTVRKVKFDGSVSWEWEGDLVDGTDEWLVVYHGPEHPPPAKWARKWAAESERAGNGEALPRYVIHYVGTAAPLTALLFYDERGEFLGGQCDAALPAKVSRREVTFVDLDLDVIVRADWSYYVRDHEDFERNRAAMGYAEGAIAAAREGVRLAEEMIRARRRPFDGHGEAVLGRVLAAQGPL